MKKRNIINIGKYFLLYYNYIHLINIYSTVNGNCFQINKRIILLFYSAPLHSSYRYSAPTIAAMLAGFREICPLVTVSTDSSSTTNPDSTSSTSDVPSPIQKRAAFLSTPSLYFSLPPNERYAKINPSSIPIDTSSTNTNAHIVFDYDTVAFDKDIGFCFYDFHKPEKIPLQYHHQFDLIIIDPPFITEEVWKAYAITAKLLLRKENNDQHILGTTVAENLSLLQSLFPSIHRNKFQPSIPHLVYQYDLYTTWDSPTFNKANPEIPE